MTRRWWTVLLGAPSALAGWSIAHDPTGIEQFVTRPELAAPRYMVAKHHPEAIAPGYWFVTPYSEILPEQSRDRREYLPCQTGPHIYDGDGTLIWSGACLFENRNVFNFKPVDIGGEQHLTFWLQDQNRGNDIPAEERQASGVVLNNRYEEVARSRQWDHKGIDSHEYTVEDGGKTLLFTTLWYPEYDAKELNQSRRVITNSGFRLTDRSTGKVIFDWEPTAHGVFLNESCDTTNMNNPESHNWDWFHINSVEKSLDGNFLVSSRHTSTIYKISGRDGSVLWRLGGCYGSDFVMDEDVPFLWQHHARWRSENSTHTILSLFDNGGEPFKLNPSLPENQSSAKVIILDTSSKPMTAKILRKIDRPDGDTTPFLGSVQPVTEGAITRANLLINWAEQGHIGEYDGDDRLVMEARFQSDRQRTYRAYKYNFIGRPTEPPAFKMLPIGGGRENIALTLYASWNGATEVRSWAFWGSDLPTGPFERIARIPKQGFETSWVSSRVVKFGYAVALDLNGKELQRSTVHSILPERDGNFTVNSPSWDLTSSMHSALAPDGELDFDERTDAFVFYDFVSNTQSLVVLGFALYGACSVARTLGHRIRIRRKGYRALDMYASLP